MLSTEGLFKTSSCRHAPQLSPIFCCAKTPRIRDTAEEGESNPLLIAVRYPAYGVRQGKKWNHAEFSFGFISDIKRRYPR